MPEFNESKYVDVDFNIDIDEFFEKCDNSEIDEVIDWLIDKGYINESQKPTNDLSFDEEQLHKNLDKIKNSYYILSNEDEEIIKQISNKL
jgi:hypothetical protein